MLFLSIFGNGAKTSVTWTVVLTGKKVKLIREKTARILA